ncbi:membrane protein [Caballeronia sordidicola]|uniref:Membrane protein n=1 Tax=Caballeronia sordidicola TaxID=196367 RepID=A0A226X001_CABSO|nr:membrane protein [Caballeronia sordidicola]
MLSDAKGRLQKLSRDYQAGVIRTFQSNDMNSTVLQSNRTFSLYWNFAPAVMALGYPWYLAWFYTAVSDHSAAGVLVAVACVLAVPASAFASLLTLARLESTDGRVTIFRRLAHFTFASPPLFVIVGVLLYLIKVNGADAKVWLGLWSAIIVGSILVISTMQGRPARHPLGVNTAPVRVLHGISSVVIVVVFVFPHLGNHAVGILGTNIHHSVMLVLRHVYRAGWLEPILIGLFFFQVISGLVLLVPKLDRKLDVLGSLQTASGAYLVIFIASHINSVFILARYFGTDTDYAWATGAPAGLTGDPWEVRLIPHYSLGVLLVLCHIVCGLRTVMLTHGVRIDRANKICWLLITASTVWTTVVVLGMLGVRV